MTTRLLSQPLRRYVAWAVLCNAAFVAVLALRPGGAAVTASIDAAAQVIAPLLVLPCCFGGAGRLWRRDGRAQRWIPLILGLALVSSIVATILTVAFELAMHRDAPFPSWIDALNLAARVLILIAIILLPTRSLPRAARVRAVLDGLMTTTALATFSWYYMLGPTFIHAGLTPFGKVVDAAYPLGDLVLMVCLLLLAGRTAGAALRPAERLFVVALGAIVVADTASYYQVLQGQSAPTSVTDAGWTLGMMVGGLGALALRRALDTLPARVSTNGGDVAHDRRVGASAVPYTLASAVPYLLALAVGTLVVSIWRSPGDDGYLQNGVYLGAAVLVTQLLARQVLALAENRRLYGALRQTYRQLEDKSAETTAYARHMEQLNEQLRVMHDEVETKNAALVRANRRLETMATTDPLTRLPNHRALIAMLDAEIERARRYERPCAVLFIDLDHFKALNDGRGHLAGDAALRELGAVVRLALRGADLLGRWGGEEFLAILPEAATESALVAAEHVRVAVAAHAFSAGVRLTCSIGLASYPEDAGERDALIGAADRALYAAKRLGRNQVRATTDDVLAALDGLADPHGWRDDAVLTGTVEALAALVSARDHYIGRHTHMVAALAMRLALALGHNAADARLIGLAAQLHDVGKVAVPDAVLQKTDPLSDAEWAIVRAHPIVGADVVGRIPALRPLAPLIRAHHERWDGMGYPDRLGRDQLPPGARIIAVADAYGAMTSDRPYRRAWPPALALAELQRCAGTQFDPAVVEAMGRMLEADLSLSERHTTA